MTEATPLFALSIVVPVYNGAASVPSLVEALARLEIPGRLEIVLVNDCSPDNSLDVCRELCRANNVALSVVNLSRNYGEHNAVMAGLSHARGAYIITMDDDLQNPPEEVVRLWRHASDNDYDVVYTYYAEKKHEAWRNLGSRFTNWCADHLLDKPKGLYLSSFRCMSAFLARQVVAHDGPFPYVDGLIMQITQRIGRLQVSHLPRAEGRSNYTLARLLRLFLSMFLNFSVIPLRVGTLVGVAMAGLGIFGFVFVLIEALLSEGAPQGWASLMAAVLLLAGVQLIMLGLVGEYLGRMFLTINKRPQFVVRDVLRNEKARAGEQIAVEVPTP
ncbi:glycosyltransferase family 2 protein [Ferrovibrio sp.]|uniref:glycosyltransferase family 2 protein n=1 Tax=Ferrovibrio sp. TaxID=1917215 RepID=UPI001B50A842|nr:glycosyltransferase family 2 protein [Ferrovibrio sp.]MBP7064908.1 glycosyltransferase family 2 protein [Ferrovibrio sp.]